ncbi:hypothetical protein [Roseibium sp. RKSG952]|uniref:hypothetical protein n=1 Tax=Roseibium sp. RKSG952 TaxID=2529384 RepID=UPI0012BCA0B6|nr:hypothetical protein [Roseibium sp. RKSG952]MTH96565.1 hypothetical protein [Roseibium sp. RKSG952]
MTFLANTNKFVVEFEQRPKPHMTITRKSDGLSIMIKAKGLAGMFRDCLKTRSPDKVTETFIRMLYPTPTWKRFHKEGVIPAPADGERVG